MEQRKIILVAVAAIAALLVVFNATFVVRQQEQAMVVALGRVVRQVETPGMHVKVPFYEQVVYFDRRLLNNESPTEEVQTLDKERVLVDSFTRWQIVDPAKFYRNVRTIGTAVQRLDTIVNSNIREQVALVKLGELVGEKRDSVMKKIYTQSALQASAMGIRIVDVRLKRADLPQENSEAVFRRMRAERQKEAAQLRAEGEEAAQKIRSEAEKTRTILLADAKRDAQKLWGEGEAQATTITGAAFNKDPSFYRFTKSLEAYKAALNPSNTLMVVDPSSDFMRTMVNP